MHDPVSNLRTSPGGNLRLATGLIILFFALFLISSILFYTRWYLPRVRRLQPREHRLPCRRPRFVFHSDHPSTACIANRGLDASVLNSLPVFTFSANTHQDSAPECAVCLSDFEENESGRVLPKCNHSFHIDCIDMWFHSHSACPLCRAPVEEHHPVKSGDVCLTVPNLVVNGPAPELLNSSSGAENEEVVGTSSSQSPRKLSVDVGMRLGRFSEGKSSGVDEPGTSPRSFRSLAISRMLSSRSVLSRERSRRSMCTNSIKEMGNCGCGPDLERGEGTRLAQWA